ncbi:MAG: Glycosyltransferase Gtf1 [Haliscomenobacter sp.]|nr:Glycosyltransferase Gtf1 [Haliscomenobacter sp.]
MKIAMLGDLHSINTQSWIKGLESAGAEVISWTLPVRPNLLRLIYFMMDVWGLRQWLKTNQPDVLIAYRTTSYGFIGALMYFHPFVIAAQGIDDVFSKTWWVNLLSRLSARYAIHRADLIHAWAINMTPALEQKGAIREKILVMPRGIDLNKFVFNARSFECRPLRLIVTRSLYPEYHIDTIIEAVALLLHNKQAPDIRLTITGSGPMEMELKDRCSQLGIANKVEFTGRISNDEIAGLLNENDFYLSMPDTEGASASLFEAFACGLFPIVSDLPANRVWLKDKQNGLLIAETNASELAEQILYAWQNPEFCRKAVEKNRVTTEESLSLEKNMKVFLDCYQKLLTSDKSLVARHGRRYKANKWT